MIERARTDVPNPESRPDLAIDPTSLLPLRWTRWWLGLLLVVLAIAAGLAFLADLPAARLASALPRGQVRVWEVITSFGTSGYMFALGGATAAAALVWRKLSVDPIRRRRLDTVAARACFFLTCIAASGILAQTIKHLVGRLRPKFNHLDEAFTLIGPSWQRGADSFPSGHTTSAFAAALALGLFLPRLRLPLAAAAVLIGASRVMTSNHYPSDVMAGAALGATVSLGLAVWLSRSGLVFGPPRDVRGVEKTEKRRAL